MTRVCAVLRPAGPIAAVYSQDDHHSRFSARSLYLAPRPTAATLAFTPSMNARYSLGVTSMLKIENSYCEWRAEKGTDPCQYPL
jgi:hypothetical protein